MPSKYTDILSETVPESTITVEGQKHGVLVAKSLSRVTETSEHRPHTIFKKTGYFTDLVDRSSAYNLLHSLIPLQGNVYLCFLGVALPPSMIPYRLPHRLPHIHFTEV